MPIRQLTTPVALLSVVPAFWPVAIEAQTGPRERILACAAIPQHRYRLDCFETLAESFVTQPVTFDPPKTFDPPNTVDPPTIDNGAWALLEETNPVDDTRTVALTMYASSGQSRHGEPIPLVIRCLSGQIEVFINWGDYISGERQPVLTRIGGASPQRKRWRVFSDNTTFYPDNDVEFIEALLQADRFVAQTTPYNKGRTTAVFELTGMANVIEPFRQVCTWN